MVLLGRNYRIGILTILMEDEFKSSRITLQPVLRQLNRDTRLFVLLNSPHSYEIGDFFDGRRHVQFSCAGRNLGVAGGRNFLCRQALGWGADILVCYDNDFLPPGGYLTLICQALVKLAQRKHVGIIAPALLNGNACSDYWSAGYDRCARDLDTAGICREEISFVPEDMRQFLRTRLPHTGDNLFYHLGIRAWRIHYVKGLSPRLELLRDRLHGLIPIVPLPPDYKTTMLVRDPEVQQAVLGGSDPIPVDTLPGGAHCFFASLLRELGGYDDNFNPYGFEDSDLCIRALRAGYCNYLMPAITLIHDVAERHIKRDPFARLQMRGRGRRILLTKFTGGRLSYCANFTSALLLEPVMIFRQEIFRRRNRCERFAAAKAFQGTSLYLYNFLTHRLDRSKAVHTFPLGPRKILFIPHNAYHTLNMSYALPYLHRLGMETLFVNIEGAYRNEGASREIQRLALHYVDYTPDVLEKEQPDLIVVMNDWGGVVYQTVREANRVGIPTVAIVEGVQDFEDTHVAHIGVGRIRRPYRTAKYVLAVGDYDRNFLPAENVFVVGMSRIEPLLAATPVFATRPVAAINCNFTYGLYTDQRGGWIDSAVAACAQAHMDYVITQHHADEMDLRGYPVTSDPIYDVLGKCTIVISRFSSVLLEAMALGKPVVYHNPHGERMDTFRDPRGAYRITHNSAELTEALQESLTWVTDYRERCQEFFRYHVSVESKPSGERTAAAMTEILRREPRPVRETIMHAAAPDPSLGARYASRLRGTLLKLIERLKRRARDVTG